MKRFMLGCLAMLTALLAPVSSAQADEVASVCITIIQGTQSDRRCVPSDDTPFVSIEATIDFTPGQRIFLEQFYIYCDPTLAPNCPVPAAIGRTGVEGDGNGNVLQLQPGYGEITLWVDGIAVRAACYNIDRNNPTNAHIWPIHACP